MPYISEYNRKKLDQCIDDMVACIRNNINATDNNPYPNPHSLNIEPEQLLNLAGDMNYCVSRMFSAVMGKPSYQKIAIITGVLENIKQEFYRRVAAPYEDSKIVSNGDIKEYKNI
jgi:hypothetical protein